MFETTLFHSGYFACRSLFFIGALLINLYLGNLEGVSASNPKITCLYNSLDPLSIAQHLALYQLYPETKEGQQALLDSWQLLSGRQDRLMVKLPPQNTERLIESLIALVNKKPNEKPPELSEEHLIVIESLGKDLGNRSLKGYFATCEAEILMLPSSEIDLAKGLFLSQFDSSPASRKTLRSYEALIDLIALQIKTRLNQGATAIDKINAINRFIFYEMNFRFPPQSQYAKEIDLYTFLPSVLDSRRGVCLGVSILYLAIAQRLNLPLEIVTPPGHIYVRYREKGEIINIETTARGVHIHCNHYLGVDTCKLQLRDLKEVIGMAYFNQASALLSNGNYGEALACYETASKYQPEDILIKEFMGYCCLQEEDEDRGRALLGQTVDQLSDYTVSENRLPCEYLNGHADKEAIRAILMRVDESRESILSKQAILQKTLSRCPRCGAAIFALAATWMQLHRHGEALEMLRKFHELSPNDATAEYYLAALYAERYDYPQAWHHLHNAEALTGKRGYTPKALKELRQELSCRSPDPAIIAPVSYSRLNIE